MIADTAAEAWSIWSKTASTVLTAWRLPEDPHDDLGGDAEGALGADEEAGQVVALRVARAPPSHTISPSGRTTSRPSTWLTVTPYFSVCGPPELLAMLPPMVQACWLEGSGA